MVLVPTPEESPEAGTPASGDLSHDTPAVPGASTVTVPTVARNGTIDAATARAAAVAGDAGNDLMLALQEGDSRALNRLFALYNSKLFSFVVRIVADPPVAEDIVQETWLTLYEHRMSYQPTYRFSTWLFTIARRKALSELRRRNVRSVVRSLTFSRRGEESIDIDPPQSTFCGPDASADGALVARLVERALATLTAGQREIVLLRDVEGFDNEEIAAILGWTVKPGALRKRIFDAREAFRKAMIEVGYSE